MIFSKVPMQVGCASLLDFNVVLKPSGKIHVIEILKSMVITYLRSIE